MSYIQNKNVSGKKQSYGLASYSQWLKTWNKLLASTQLKGYFKSKYAQNVGVKNRVDLLLEYNCILNANRYLHAASKAFMK